MPFSIVLAVVTLQSYFKKSAYSLITVENVSDVLKFPDERFFKIKNYYVFRERYHVEAEQHEEGRYGTRLKASNYFTAPMYDDSFRTNDVSKIGYGVYFSDIFAGSLQSAERKESEIRKFNKKSETDYFNHNFYDGNIFERVFNSIDADYYKYSWSLNRFSNKLYTPVVLIRLKGSIENLHKRDWNLTVYSVPLAYLLTVIVLFLFYFYKEGFYKSEPLPSQRDWD